MHPRTGEEFQTRFAENQHVSGHGLTGVAVSVPCPFCGAADFAAWHIVSCEADMQKETTCPECKRSGRSILTLLPSGGKQMEFVQTAGDPPPDYLMPPPALRTDLHDVP